MIFADKLILLRKKAGWSQEELAEQMDVTRQSVSKWEGAQSVPRLRQNDTSFRAVRSKYGLFAEGRNGRCRAHRFVQGHAVIKAGIHGGSKRVSFCKRQNSQNDCVCRFFLCILSPIALLILAAINQSTAGAPRAKGLLAESA